MERVTRLRGGLLQADGSYKPGVSIDELHELSDAELAVESVESQINAIAEQAKKLREKSNLGKRFMQRTFDTFEAERFPKQYELAYNYAIEFNSNSGEGLLLMGNPGTGKTHLTAAIANYVIDTYGIPVLFVNYIDLIENVKESFNTGKDVLQQYIEIPLLIIDDLTNAKGDWRNEMLYRVINSRYEANLPIIITTNDDYYTLKENLMEKTMSRLMEICKGVAMNGDDYRLRNLGMEG